MENTMKDITSINLEDRLAILDSNEIIPIISIIKHIILSGIYVCVAGPCSDGKWYVFSSDDFQKAVIH